MKVTLFICAVLLLLAILVTAKRNKQTWQKSVSRTHQRKSQSKKDKKGEGKRKHVNWPEELPVDIEDSASDSMPDDFELNLSFGKTKVKLPLGKNKRINMNLPIIYSTKKGNRVLFHGNKQLAVYKDPETEASVIVDLKHGKKKYDGVFYIGGEEYTFRPAKNTSRFSPKHVISKIKRGSDFPKGGWKESVRSPKRKETKRRDRQKRQVDELAQNTYDVEVLMVIDYSIYKTWFDLSDKVGNNAKKADAINNINFYYTHVANGVAQRYASVQDGAFRLDTFLSGIHIMADDTAPWREHNLTDASPKDILDGPAAIISFDDWLTDDLPSHDHAALFMNDDLRGWSGRTGIYGMSKVKGICSDDESTSINRDVGLYSIIQTFAHELGHNLGASHDGSGNTCTFADQFVMAQSPVTLSMSDASYQNTFSFSSCSTEDFIEYIIQLEAEGNNCLDDEGSNIANMNTVLQTLPGQRFPPDQQCEVLYGTGAYFCRGVHLDLWRICEDMRCFNPAAGRCVTDAEQRAAPGTTCGHKKWCNKNNLCVDWPTAPATLTFCHWGDYSGTFPGGLTCDRVVAEQPELCAQSPYLENCCVACAFGALDCVDKFDWCPDQQYTCYSQQTRNSTCCETCRSGFDLSKPGCEFGDKQRWCQTCDTSITDPERCCDFCSHLL